MNKSIQTKLVTFALGLTVALGASSANAGLLGNNATCAIQPSGLWACDTGAAVIADPTTEFKLKLNGNDFFSANFTDSTLTLTLISQGGLGMGAGELATFGGLFGASSVTGFASVGENGFDLTDVSFSSGMLTLNLNGSSWGSGDTAVITFDSAQVPEPATVALLGLALAGLGATRRSRKGMPGSR